jgi:hypothetical protein
MVSGALDNPKALGELAGSLLMLHKNKDKLKK